MPANISNLNIIWRSLGGETATRAPENTRAIAMSAKAKSGHQSRNHIYITDANAAKKPKDQLGLYALLTFVSMRSVVAEATF